MATQAPAKKMATFSSLVAEAKKLHDKIEAAKLAIKPDEIAFDELEERILQSLLDSNTESHKVGSIALGTVTVSVKRSTVPKVADWAKVNKYVVKNNATDLYQARLHVAAYNERVAAGEKIPGIETFDVKSLAWRWK